MIAIIDYGAGNLASVKKAFDYIGVDSVITDDANVVLNADGVVLPGVGAISYAMDCLKSKGMDEVVGPLNYSDLEREGLLIEGFDYLSTFEEQYNHPYYQKLIENFGFTKDVDWIEHRLTINKEKYEKLSRVSDMLLARGNFKVVKPLKPKQFYKQYGDQFFSLLDETYDKIYGTVPFSQGMKDLILHNYAPIVNKHYMRIVVNNDNKIIAFALAFPNVAEAMQMRNGHLRLIPILKLLHTVRHPKIIDLGLVGVLPSEALGGSQIVLFKLLAEQIIKDNIQYF